MKTKLTKSVSSLLGVVLISFLASCSKEQSVPQPQTGLSPAYLTLAAQINALPADTLSAEELQHLLWLREEEKLARDVYKNLFSRWNITVFSNIAASEQSHMDAVLLLLRKYGIADPADPAEGVFHNAALQALYYQLTSAGAVSLAAAYRTGATIEDLDLKDLEEAGLDNNNADIRLVLESLEKGSRNHLRSFYKNLLSAGETYTAQYITPEELALIISTPMETGN